MVVKVSKPEINVREKINELDKPSGVAGQAMLAAETPQEQFNLIGAGRRNLIINGGMQVAQRATAATQAGNGTYDTVDRIMTWSIPSGSGRFTGSQSTGHQLATGHDTAYKVDVTATDTSLASGDYYEFLHRIEARNIQHLRWGTAAAKNLQVSFWVRATKTGVQSIFFSKQGTGAQYRNVINYTINATDTWEYKTLEVPALTASTIANDSATYLQIGFVLGMGSGFANGTAGTWTTNSLYTTADTVNHMDSTSNDFYLTGLQIEVGEVATPFEHRFYGEELALCQRYCQIYTGTDQEWIYIEGSQTTHKWWQIYLQTAMRADPSVTFPSSISASIAGSAGTITTMTSISGAQSPNRISIRCTCSGTGGNPYELRHTDGLDGQVFIIHSEL